MKIKFNLFKKGLLNDGEHIMLRGQSLTVSFSKVKTVKPLVYCKDDKIIVHTSETNGSTHREVLEKYLRKEAKSAIIHCADRFCNQLGIEYKRISVKDQKSRWGSCSSKKNLNFNWRLVLAPNEVMEYVVAHEVAHLKHMNHSQSFWSCVEELYPSYKSSVRWLKENGMKLHMY